MGVTIREPMERANDGIYNNEEGYKQNNTQEDIQFSKNDYVGSPITAEKENNVFRVQCRNCNGLNLDEDGGTYGEYCDEINRFQVDTISIPKRYQSDG